MTDLQVPDRPVMMQTNRDFRLSSLHGYVVNFKANVPERVPPQCYIEAIGIGAVECKEQPEAPQVEEKQPHPTLIVAAELEAEAFDTYVTQACLALIAKGDEQDFKADGYPRIDAVVRELAPQCTRPTAGDVMRIYDSLRDDASLIEDD